MGCLMKCLPRRRCEKKYSVCGTPNYIAPEVLDGKNGHSFPADVWWGPASGAQHL